MTVEEAKRRTVDDVLADYKVIFSGRTRYEGQEPRDDELMVAEIEWLRAELAASRVAGVVLVRRENLSSSGCSPAPRLR